MSSRKRRSNRLTVEQLEANADLREQEQNQPVVLIGFGQEHLDPSESLYRSVALRVALQMVRDGDAEKFTAGTTNGRVVFFRELKPVTGAVYCLPTMPNARTAEALAGLLDGNNSRRISNVLMFPFEGDRKSPLTGPRVSEMDRTRALRRLGQRPATAGHCYRDIRVLRNELPVAA